MESRGKWRWTAGGLMLLLCLFTVPFRVDAGERNTWVTKKQYRYYYDENGKLVRSGIKEIGAGKYCFDSKGHMLKKTMKVIRGKRYYFTSSGKAAVGWVRYRGNKYYFDSLGRGVKGLAAIGKYQYFFADSGVMQSGWQYFGKKKAYFYLKTGRMAVNRTIQGTKINKKGYAKAGRTELARQEALEKAEKLLDSITSPGMSKSQKLRAAFDYMSSRSNLTYVTWRSFQAYKGWEYDYAIEIYDRRGGNCYNFASGFAMLAKVIGYEPYVVRGRVRGSRDGAADGLTRHACVSIDGLYYDPELQFAGTSPGIYGVSYSPMIQILGRNRI